MGEINERNESWKLTNIELFKERNDDFDEYLLKAEYEVDTGYVKKKITIPRMKLNVKNEPFIDRLHASMNLIPQCYVDLGFGVLECIPNERGICYTETVLEMRPRKMTLEEVEKKFGYPIEIVSEKSKRGRKWEDMV